jgi:hypothetical protein
VNGFILLFVNAVVVASPLLGYKLASYTWLLWMGCLVPLLTAYSLAKVPFLLFAGRDLSRSSRNSDATRAD